jgi:hypothetical protein
LVIVSIRLTVPTVVPLAFLSVIVTVVEPARSARSCQETFCDPPAATVATDCVALCGLFNRTASLGEKLITTERPLAADVPVLVTVAVAVNDWPRAMVAGTPLSAIVVAAGAPPVGVKVRVADQLPTTPAEFFARTRHQCVTDDKPVTLVCDAVDVRLRTSGAVKPLLSST